MTKDEFLGHYWSHPIPWNGKFAYVRGHSPWVEGIFHPNRDIHDLAQWHLDLASKYDRRWHWLSPRVPPPLWTMVFIETVSEEPPNFVERLLGKALALYAFWRSL